METKKQNKKKPYVNLISLDSSNEISVNFLPIVITPAKMCKLNSKIYRKLGV